MAAQIKKLKNNSNTIYPLTLSTATKIGSCNLTVQDYLNVLAGGVAISESWDDLKVLGEFLVALPSLQNFKDHTEIHTLDLVVPSNIVPDKAYETFNYKTIVVFDRTNVSFRYLSSESQNNQGTLIYEEFCVMILDTNELMQADPTYKSGFLWTPDHQYYTTNELHKKFSGANEDSFGPDTLSDGGWVRIS